MSTVIESVSKIMTRYISIDINKARPWIFYIMVSQENLELHCEALRKIFRPPSAEQ